MDTLIINKYKSNIRSLIKFEVDFNPTNNSIDVTYYLKQQLSIAEERELAKLEVLILERIEAYHVNFYRIYKR